MAAPSRRTVPPSAEKAFPPRSILVPMDLSKPSMNAWGRAKGLAEKFGSTLEVLFVDPWPAGLRGDRGANERGISALRRLRAAVGAEVPIHVSAGAVDMDIARRARRFDLVVVGTEGRDGLDRALRSSVAEAVVRSCPAPVLVARRGKAKISSVLAPVNFEEHARAGLEWAAAAAAAFGASLTALHVVEKHRADFRLDESRWRLQEWLAALPMKGVRAEAVVAAGDPSEEIARLATGHDLVVLAAHQRGFFRDIVIGTTAERLLRHLPCSVMTVPS